MYIGLCYWSECSCAREGVSGGAQQWQRGEDKILMSYRQHICFLHHLIVKGLRAMKMGGGGRGVQAMWHGMA